MSLVRNERLKLLATALNNLGIGAMIAGIVAPLVNGSAGDFAHIAAWFIFGVDLIAIAQAVLGRLR